MIPRYAALAVALLAPSAVLAATSNVDYYGVLYFGPVDVYSAAQDQGSPSSPPDFVAQRNSTTTSGATAAISTSGYLAAARTSVGANHVFLRADDFGNGAIATTSLSRWADAFTVSGGSGQATMQFTVRLRGVVDVGQFGGGVSYTLYADSAAPGDLASFDGAGWATPIHYDIGISPFIADNGAAAQAESFDNATVGSPQGISGGYMPPPPPPVYQPDMTLHAGANQLVDLMFTGSFDFTYGQTYHLVSEFGAGIHGFTPFGAPAGSGPTTLDFLNGAWLSGIVLPSGASVIFESGAGYPVATVPEPAEWALLLAGLGLIGWRTRRRG